jgi:hypothetical protein
MTSELPELRQVVLLTNDLESALTKARDFFKVPVGYRDVEGMANIGFRHEIFGFDRTYVEICEPLDPESAVGKRAAAAESGFMAVVQVERRDDAVQRASDLGVAPLFTKDHHGSPISQWHPRDFGTIAEIDELVPPTSWHFAPGVYDSRSTDVVADFVSLHLSVKDPESMAQRWAHVLGVGCNGQSVDVNGRELVFTSQEGLSNVFRVDCIATDRSRAGESLILCGVEFRLV